MPEPTGSEVGMASETRNRYKSPVTAHVAAELIKAEGRMLYSEIHRLIYSMGRKDRTAVAEEGDGHCTCFGGKW